MSTALRGLTAALGIISVGAAGKAYLYLADEAKNLTAQLKLATAQSGNFGQAQADVKRIAEATRNGLAEPTDLYAPFLRNGRELGDGKCVVGGRGGEGLVVIGGGRSIKTKQ